MTDPVPCPECGSRPHPNDRYCPECGAQLTAEASSVRDATADALAEPLVAGAAPTVPADAAIGAAEARPFGAATAAGDGASTTAGGLAGEAAGQAAGAAVDAPVAAPAAYGTWSPRVASGPAPGAGSAADPLPASRRDADGAAGVVIEPGRRGAVTEPDASAAGDRPISPAAAAAAAAAVAAADNRESAATRRSPDANGEDAGWFAATSAGSMLALGLLLVAAGVLLVLVGKIDRTGTVGIFGLLIAVGGVFMIPLAAVRAVADRVL